MQHKIHAWLIALLASVAFAGCTSDDDVADGGAMKQLSFSAIVDGGNVRAHAADRMKTQLQHDNSVTFCEDDAISVFDATTLRNRCFATLESGATVTFSGVAPESTTYTALYPYQEGATISGQTITAVLPTTQYAQAGTTFDPQAVLSVATTTKAEMTFAFKNVCSLLKFTTTEPLAKIVFKGNNQEKVAGNVSITVSAEPTATGTAESIELLPAEGASIPAGTYYIAVLPQKFEKGFKIEGYQDASSATPDYFLHIQKENVLVERACVYNVGELQYDSFRGHDYVDLGIEVAGKKVLWATMNIGASAPEKSGDYFAWGEIAPYYQNWDGNGNPTSWKSGRDGGYKFNSYCRSISFIEWNPVPYDDNHVLKPAYDAAHANWGGDWVMPTQAEWQAFIENTTSTWTGDYNGTGVAGRKFTSNINGNSIFLPAAGYIFDKQVRTYYRACYWSSSLNTNATYQAWRMRFDESKVYNQVDDRYYGYPVRPVIRMTK